MTYKNKIFWHILSKILTKLKLFDVEAKNDDWETPLIFAVESGEPDMVRYLYEQCHAKIIDNAMRFARTDEIKEYLQSRK